MKSFELPKELILGSATSSCQIEGGDKNNNWYRWCQKGYIKDGTNCYIASDHYKRYKEDIALMKKLNQESYRMSIEWSRLEPQCGKFCKKSLAHYKDEIRELVKVGIKPLVTLHHFSHPIWFEDIGGFEKSKNIKYYLRYVKKIVSEFGDLVTDWITFNEPNVYTVSAYFVGLFPPGKFSSIEYLKVSKNVILAHLHAYRLIHKVRTEKKFFGKTKVGVAYHISYLQTMKENIILKQAKKLIDYAFHSLFLEGMIKGKIMIPGVRKFSLERKDYCDFIGVNYYTRYIINFGKDPFTFYLNLEMSNENKNNDLGWEIYPKGLYYSCKQLYEKYNLPLFITENGICDEKDSIRSNFIYSHLFQIYKLTKEEIPIERYYYWSILDNFEWLEGLKIRFGLIHVNYNNQRRTIRKSAYFYSEIIKQKKVTDEMIEKYLGENND